LEFEQKPEHNSFNRKQHDWILQNYFEYGYNSDGGRKFASINQLITSNIEESEIKKILDGVPSNFL
jgi:hypothetical protein